MMAGHRGRCAECGKGRSLDDDGMIRRHRRHGSTETGPLSQSRDLCYGSYERPLGWGSVASPLGLPSSA